MTDLDNLYRAKWTAETRREYYKSHPENFAGNADDYPIKDASDVNDAWRLAGHADNPDAVRAKVKRIAKRLGLESGLPDTAKEDDKQSENRSAVVDPSVVYNHTSSEPTAINRSANNHEPFTGKHSHSHPAHDSQGDDATHEHEHSHDGDNNHDHEHSEDRATAATSAIQVSDRLTMSLPLVRIDAMKREVWGQATAEVPDSYKTIFGYYPDAWLKWRGNIREQHDPKKAIGRAVEINPDPQERAIYVGSRVSRGAQDTWLKVEDNVLTGYSASIIPDPEYGSDPRKWPQKEYQGKKYPYLPRYTVAELSLVDNPACPGCDIQIVRADGFATDVLDFSEEVVTPEPEKPQERSGARVSKDTQGSMHTSIGHTLMAAMSQMKNCGCECCQAAMKMIDPDGDDDVDLGGYLDPDGDWQSLYNNQQSNDDMDRALAIVERVLGPAYTRLQGIAGALARNNVLPANNNTTTLPDETLITGAIERAVKAVQVAHDSSLAEVRAVLTAVKEQVDAIAATPVPGAPILNTSALPRPAEKRLVSDPSPNATASPGATYDAMLSQFQQRATSGVYRSLDEQVRDMAAVLAAQPSLPRR